MSQNKLSEKQIETAILEHLNKFVPGFFAFKVNTVGIWDAKRKIYRKNNNRFIIKGTSDIIGLWSGRFVAIEVKAGRNKATPEQLEFLQRVKENGGLALVAYSLMDVVNFIEFHKIVSEN